MAETTNKKATTTKTTTRTRKKAAAKEADCSAAAAAIVKEDEAKAENPVSEKDTEIELLKKQLKAQDTQMAKLQAMIDSLRTQPQPQIVTVSADTPKVNFLWQAEVSDDNIVDFGPYGSITGKTGRFFVPKPELSRVLDTMTRTFLAERWLIVLSGLDEDEREALGVNYKEGELLDEKAFAKIVGMGKEILEIFPDLCESHKQVVAKRYYEAWQSKTMPIDRDVVIALYKMYPSDAFKAVKEGLDAEELN